MKKKLVMSWLLIVLCSCLSACFGPLKQKPMATYRLDVNANVVKSNPTRLVLMVSDPVSVAGFDTVNMAYVEDLYRLNYFSQNRWVDTPSNMLKALMVNALQDTEHFKAVVGSPFSGVTDYYLDTTIVKLQQIFIDTKSNEQFVVRAQLINNSNRNVVAVRTFTLSEPAPFNTPYGGVIAANLAVREYLEQLAQFVVDYT